MIATIDIATKCWVVSGLGGLGAMSCSFFFKENIFPEATFDIMTVVEDVDENEQPKDELKLYTRDDVQNFGCKLIHPIELMSNTCDLTIYKMNGISKWAYQQQFDNWPPITADNARWYNITNKTFREKSKLVYIKVTIAKSFMKYMDFSDQQRILISPQVVDLRARDKKFGVLRPLFYMDKDVPKGRTNHLLVRMPSSLEDSKVPGDGAVDFYCSTISFAQTTKLCKISEFSAEETDTVTGMIRNNKRTVFTQHKNELNKKLKKNKHYLVELRNIGDSIEALKSLEHIFIRAVKDKKNFEIRAKSIGPVVLTTPTYNTSTITDYEAIVFHKY